MKKTILAAVVITAMILIIHVPGSQSGTLQFYANGEDLITEGFIPPKQTKDGWTLTFSHAFVALSHITGYQTDPPYDAHSGNPVSARETVTLQGVHVVDLAAGSEDNPSVFVGEVKGAPPGHYNALSWQMVRDNTGLLDGYSMLLIGKAEKDGETVDFRIRTKEEAVYTCGEFVGDERKGFLNSEGSADLEMTFHFDHVFGRADKDANDPVNLGAIGFDPFADSSRVHDIKLEGMHIGHAGEGHCAVEWK
jgi:hypothetical protein